MDSAVTVRVERRRTQRRRAVRDHGIESVRIRRGIHVAVIDACGGGVLVETTQRLLPGMPLEIHLGRGRQTTTVRGRVLRCAVVRLTASLVSYRGAIGFDQPLSWLTGCPPEKATSGSSFTNTEVRETAAAG